MIIWSAGNLGRVDYISEFEYDLFIRPDTCNPRYRVWFYFTVENVKADQVCWRILFWIMEKAADLIIATTMYWHTAM